MQHASLRPLSQPVHRLTHFWSGAQGPLQSCEATTSQRCLQGIEITIKDELVSKPYVEMTIKLMEKFGIVVNRLEGLQKLHIPGRQTYQTPGTVFVEGDASSASYFLAGATMTGGTIRVVGCGSESVQVRAFS